MTGPATQQAPENRNPTEEERKHIIDYHIGIQISTLDGTATVTVLGECAEPVCPTNVFCSKYCRRPPC
jgi:hypothetical protein